MSDADDIPTGRKRRPRADACAMRWACLVRREHSRKELTRKLTARGIEDEAAQAAVANRPKPVGRTTPVSPRTW